MNARSATLLLHANGEGAVMAADDMVYAVENGRAVPAECHVRKVFAVGSVLIGIAGMLRSAEIGFKSEDWVVSFIREQRKSPDDGPEAVARSLEQKIRHTFKSFEGLPQRQSWTGAVTGNPLITCVVAGYSADFDGPGLQIFEVGVQYNSSGHDLEYVGPTRHDPSHLLAFGEGGPFTAAFESAPPHASIYGRQIGHCTAAALESPSNAPLSLRELAVRLAALVKVEAEFNADKVGDAVNVAILDRPNKRYHLARF